MMYINLPGSQCPSVQTGDILAVPLKYNICMYVVRVMCVFDV